MNIVTIVVAVIGLLGSTGIWGYVASRREAPLRHREVESASRYKEEQTALAMATEAREQAKQAREHADWIAASLRKELEEERVQRARLTERVRAQEMHTRQQDRMIDRLKHQLQAFSDAWDDLIEHWATYRLSEKPPPRPTDSN